MRNIILLGLVSFFADISTEMIYPIIPLYLTGVLGATPALIGVIEGIAESMASFLKVGSGYFTDKYKHKKAVAFVGYGMGLIYKLILIFAASWVGVLIARVTDRIGKGLRTSPRDVLVTENSKRRDRGKSFGIHKAMDMAGSAIGILIAYFLLAEAEGSIDYTHIFIISIFPLLIGLAALLQVKEKKEPKEKEKHQETERRISFSKQIKELDRNLKLYLTVALIFTLGNSSNTFLLLKAKETGFSDTNVVLLYFIYNLSAAILSLPLGYLSDKIGRKHLLVTGYFVFTIVYLGFGFAQTKVTIIAVFILYGVFTAATAGVERALISEIAPSHLKGTMLGLHATIVGMALLPASIICGALWNEFGSLVPFIFGAALSLTACLLLIFFLKIPKKEKEQQ